MRDPQPVYDENVPLVDRDTVNEHTFGVTEAKTHPEFVFSIRGVSCLVHKVQYVTIRWYDFVDMKHLARFKRPRMIAHTNCQQFFELDPRRSRTCEIPSPDALLCGRCHGDGATFPKRANGVDRKRGLTRHEAHVKLGCVIKGY